MNIRSIFFTLTCMMVCLALPSCRAGSHAADAPVENSSDPVVRLDRQIAKLENAKTELQARADFHGRQAERLLFLDYLGYRSQIRYQDECNTKLVEVQEQLDKLRAEREQLIRQR